MSASSKLARWLQDPLLPLDRGCRAYGQWRRRRTLTGTVAAGLRGGQLSTLELLRLLRDHPPRVIYDIGAMVGKWTRLAKACYPDAQIHAFEPLPFHQGRFREETRQFSGVALHEVALGSSQGTLSMAVASASAGSSLLPLTSNTQEWFGIHTVGHQDVPVVVLDDYAAAHALPPPDLIKLDVQGFELEALKGADQAVGRAQALLIEVSFVEIYRDQPLFHEIERYCLDRGFRIQAFGADTCLGRDLRQADVLFVRRPGASASES